ncbi:MAG: hypothetical protein ABSE73_25770 [Planctomycetota bacterium]
MNDLPKRIKRQVRELADKAYERELRAHLEKLASAFDEWRAGSLGTWELTDRIHRFHDGPNRELFNKYSIGGNAHMYVAHAFVTGLLKESEVPEEVKQGIRNAIAFYRSQEKDSVKNE